MLKETIKNNEKVNPDRDLLDELQQHFPQFFDKSGNFNSEKFLAELKENDLSETKDGYRLSFVGKEYARLQTGLASETLIAPDSEHNAKPENRESGNIFITGDNLEALRHMQNAYRNRVKMIYIDPPYNTGKEFVYNDTFEHTDEKLKSALGYSEEEITRLKSIQGKSSHSAWLTFMYPRLALAKKLLTDDGVIFVSIDDNEQANLKLLMDDIFGEGNFVNKFVWVNNLKGRQIQGLGAAGTHEIIYCYARNSNAIAEFVAAPDYLKNLMPSSYKGFDHSIKEDNKGKYIITNELFNSNSVFNEASRPNLVFDIYFRDNGNKIKIEDVSNKHIHTRATASNFQ